MTSHASQIQAYMRGKAELTAILGLSAEYIAALRGRAQFFLDGGHDERALIMLEMLEELDRNDPLPTLLAIEVLLKLGRSDAAEAKIQRLLARDPDDPSAQVALAELQIATGEWVSAAQILRRVIEADPEAQTSAGQRARSVACESNRRFNERR